MIESTILHKFLSKAIMKTLLFFTFLSCLNLILSDEVPCPRIVIVGAGASGIAAASMLFTNGFNNVTILEAEDRIGGRVYSVPMGDYLVDMGGQWVQGEGNNSAYDLAWPLGLLERYKDTTYNDQTKFFMSSGQEIPSEISNDIIAFHVNYRTNISEDQNLETGSIGENMDKKLEEYFKQHPEITSDQYKPIAYLLNLYEDAIQAADDWHDISAKRVAESFENEGDQAINWKNRTYATILDILMKKYPNPEEELPVMNNTMLNSKVKKIHYDMSDGSKKVVTEDDEEYPADHIIFTGSLGVLKADHEKLFDPPLPESKVNAIKSIGMGGVGKIYLYYDNPWWIDDIYFKGLVWTEADRKEIESNPEKKWMLSVYSIIPIEHKPKLLCLWISGPYVKDMEIVPEDVLRNQTSELLNRFFGHAYNVTEPSLMRRTLWMTNDNFRGTYSYPSVETEKSNMYPADLAEPIMKDGKPILHFAGEATSDYNGLVHGAIDSGRREVKRLMELYPKKCNNS